MSPGSCARFGRALSSRTALLAGLAAGLLGACDGPRSRAEFDRQLEVCTLAESNGLLEPAAEACGAALDIALAKAYPAPETAVLAYRLARLQRQRGDFAGAERLARSALAQAELASDRPSAALRSMELALSLAGQERWLPGFEVVAQAAPWLSSLPEEDADVARSTLGLFATRLEMLGYVEQAERCRAYLSALEERKR